MKPDLDRVELTQEESKKIAIAALRSGDEGSISLGFQLARYPACKKCGYVKMKCRCSKKGENCG